MLPGKSGPKSSLNRASDKANKAANATAKDLGLDTAAKKAKANAPSQRDVANASKQAAQMRGIVQDEFADVENTANAQYRAELDENTWSSDVFDL